MNEVVVSKWFSEYEALLAKLGIEDLPGHIWNCDETGMVDHFERQRAIGVSGLPCYQVTANEKGQTVTALACFNAVGQYAPLLFVFKAKRLQASWCVGAPAGSVVKVSDNGWITAPVFAEWAIKRVRRPFLRSTRILVLTVVTVIFAVFLLQGTRFAVKSIVPMSLSLLWTRKGHGLIRSQNIHLMSLDRGYRGQGPGRRDPDPSSGTRRNRCTKFCLPPKDDSARLSEGIL